MEIVIRMSQYKILLPIVNIASIDASGDDWFLTLANGEKLLISGDVVTDLRELLPRISFFEPTSTGWVNVKQLAA